MISAKNMFSFFFHFSKLKHKRRKLLLTSMPPGYFLKNRRNTERVEEQMTYYREIRTSSKRISAKFYPYLPTPPLEQDMTLGKFLSRV